MAILAAARLKRPELGYATDFVDVAMRSVLAEIAARGIKVVSNAGGINPRACVAALEAMIAAAGLRAEGRGRRGRRRRRAARRARRRRRARHVQRRAAARARAERQRLPRRDCRSRARSAAGADIVVTGRVVDSALALGPLMHEFGWRDERLRPARRRQPRRPHHRVRLPGDRRPLHRLGVGARLGRTSATRSPSAAPTARFRITKPAGTGGLIARGAVAEQLLYEIGDPGAYVLPDVICDFRQVTIEQEGTAPRPRRRRARLGADRHLQGLGDGAAGFRAAGTLVIVGIDAVKKAERTGAAIVERTRRLLRDGGLRRLHGDHVEVIGAESSYGPHARTRDSREVMLRVVADHADRRALELFAREIAPAGTSWSPGTTGPGGGRPAVSPLVKPFSFLLDKARCRCRSRSASGARRSRSRAPAARVRPTPKYRCWRPPRSDGELEAVETLPLIRLAWARSGDKGDLSNVGVVARRAEWLPLLWERLTPTRVKAWLGHLVLGEVERFHLPGISAINFVLHEALDGGGPASRRLDPLGKGMAQLLLDMPIEVPRSVARDVRGEL